MEKMTNKQRNLIRITGIILGILSAILIIIGFMNFNVLSFIIGGILMTISFTLVNIGFVGKFHKITTSETIETTAQAKNYILNETKDNLREILGKEDSPKRICKSCGAINDINNNYCFDCGLELRTMEGRK